MMCKERVAAAVFMLGSSVRHSKAGMKKIYKSRLTYKKSWEEKYPWVYCNNPQEGMFCQICQKWGKAPPTACGGWTTRGITNWNLASQLLKQHNDSMWLRDSVIVSKMTVQPSVVELQNARASREAEEWRDRNRVILTICLFSGKEQNSSHHHLVNLQVANGDEVNQQHVTSGPSNAQYIP